MLPIFILVIVGTSLWVLFDANAIDADRRSAKGIAATTPVGWFLFCLLFWIIGFPLYLATRPEMKRLSRQRP